MCCGFIVQARAPEKKTRSERSGDGEFLCRCCVRCCKEAIRGNELAFLKIPEPSELIISQRFFFLFFEIPSISALLQTAASTSRSTFQGAGRSLSRSLHSSIVSHSIFSPSSSITVWSPPSLSLSFLPPPGRGTHHWDLEEIELNYEGISLQYDWHHFLHTTEHHSHISRCGGMKIGHAPFFLSSF